MAVKDLYNSTRIADEPAGYGFNNVFSAEMYGESRRTVMYAAIHFSEAFQIPDETTALVCVCFFCFLDAKSVGQPAACLPFSPSKSVFMIQIFHSTCVYESLVYPNER